MTVSPPFRRTPSPTCRRMWSGASRPRGCRGSGSRSRAHRLSAVILFDPVNMRYACGARNMQVYTARNPARYLFVPVEGPVVLFEYRSCEHLAAHLADDRRDPAGADHHAPPFRAQARALPAGLRGRDRGARRQAWGFGRRVGIEAATTGAVLALERAGFEVIDAQIPIEKARCIKVPGEVDMIRASLRLTEAAVAAMEAAAATRHHRDRALVAPPSGTGRRRRRLYRDAASDLRPAYQSLAPGDERADHRAGRSRRARYRRGRLLRLLQRLLPHLPRR